MLNIGIALFVFYFFLALGCLLMFLNSASYCLLLPCLLYLLILKKGYQEANCLILQGKDLLYCLMASVIFSILYQQVNKELIFSHFAYLYLITFITTMMFVNTIRFKSLV